MRLIIISEIKILIKYLATKLGKDVITLTQLQPCRTNRHTNYNPRIFKIYVYLEFLRFFQPDYCFLSKHRFAALQSMVRSSVPSLDHFENVRADNHIVDKSYTPRESLT